VSKILYIAGYGRSGSTVLDVILGNHPEIASVGEITYLLEEWRGPDRRCACGQPYQKCDFWGALGDTIDLSVDMQEIIRTVEKREYTISTLFNRVCPSIKKSYRAFNQQLFSYIRERSGKSVVVDSSKSARDAALRFYALSEIANLDVYVLHLVRDGRAVVESCVRKGSNWALEGHQHEPRLPGFRATVGWTLANTWTLGLARRYISPDRYLRVQFEDFISTPGAVLERIGGFIGIKVDVLVERVREDAVFDVGHNVGGNRMRLKEHVRLRTRETTEIGYNLDWHHRLFFQAVGGWLQWYLAGNSTNGSRMRNDRTEYINE